MKPNQVRKIYMGISLFVSFLLLAGCKYVGDVKHHPVSNLEDIEHLFSGPFLITTKGYVIIQKDQLIHANDTDDGSFETDTTKFVQIDKLDSVVKVVRGESRNFALKKNGSIWFWGEPLKYVQEGLFDSHPQVKTATKFPYADEVINLWGSGDGFIYQKKDGTVWGWKASDCQLPTNNEMASTKLVSHQELKKSQLAVHPYEWLDNAKVVGSCMTGIKSNGTVWETYDGSPYMVIGLHDIVDLQEGEDYHFSLDKNGNVWTWGTAKSDDYQLVGVDVVPIIPDSRGIKTVQKPILLMDHVMKISGAFGLKDDGTVWYLGDQSRLAMLHDIREIGGDAYKVVALANNGELFDGDPNGDSLKLYP
ncbi:hypothetical protein [Cohnella yongneupensis]|uniref:Uncharacterized protein n=1 Tax=Cohnella yongneupensis TaxID=425006 RepID=A0ABW0R7N2_9BACL